MWLETVQGFKFQVDDKYRELVEGKTWHSYKNRKTPVMYENNDYKSVASVLNLGSTIRGFLDGDPSNFLEENLILGKPKNKYFEIYDENNNLIHYELHITNAKQCGIVLFSVQDYEAVSSHTWIIKTTRSLMPSLESYETRKTLASIFISGTKYRLIRFKNSNMLDYRRENIVQTNDAGTRKGASGVFGVSYDKTNDTYIAEIKVGDKRLRKTFSVNAHGEADARRLASKQRKYWEQKLLQ